MVGRIVAEAFAKVVVKVAAALDPSVALAAALQAVESRLDAEQLLQPPPWEHANP